MEILISTVRYITLLQMKTAYTFLRRQTCKCYTPLLHITEYVLEFLQKSYAHGLPTRFRADASILFSLIIAHRETYCTEQFRGC